MAVDYVKQGKKNRKQGGDFERKVRGSLESRGYIVSKWSNNVECEVSDDVNNPGRKIYRGKNMIPAKHKFNPFNKVMTMGTGFPDFVAYHKVNNQWQIFGVEAKSNGYLDQEEKAKCRWLIIHGVFDAIWIAKKDNNGGIKYEAFN
jgi:hypothetical protein